MNVSNVRKSIRCFAYCQKQRTTLPLSHSAEPATRIAQFKFVGRARVSQQINQALPGNCREGASVSSAELLLWLGSAFAQEQVSMAIDQQYCYQCRDRIKTNVEEK